MTAVGSTKSVGTSLGSLDSDGLGSAHDRGALVSAARNVKTIEGSGKAARVAKGLLAQVPLEALTLVARKAVLKG